MHPRFQYFYDLVRIVNFFLLMQATPFIYILEKTYPGEQCTPAVTKASNLVQAFIGAPILVDAQISEQQRTASGYFGPT